MISINPNISAQNSGIDNTLFALFLTFLHYLKRCLALARMLHKVNLLGARRFISCACRCKLVVKFTTFVVNGNRVIKPILKNSE